MNSRNTKPDGGNHRAGIAHKGNSAYLTVLSELYRTRKPARIPDNWRDRLPDSLTYYSQHVSKLGKVNATGWAQGVCPFHEDRNASLSVNIAGERGLWRCFAGCGGGDLVGFHMRRTGLDFRAAVRDLIGGHA
jgi:DNA primase